MSNDYNNQYDTVSSAYQKKKMGSLGKVLLVLLWIVSMVGTAFLSSWLTAKNFSAKQASEDQKVIVYQGVETTSVSLTTSDLSNIVSNLTDSVVEVYTESVTYSRFFGEYVSSGAGSGVIYSSDGYILTNNHVIAGASKINVKLTDGTDYAATLVGTDEQTDVAVLKIEATGLKQAVLGTSSNLKVGQTCIAIGNPLGTLGGSVTSGIISALSRDITVDGQKMTLMQIDAAINPGNSGGGLFNVSGELIALVNAKSSGSDVEGIGFAIPVDLVKRVAQDLILKGYVTRPMLGIKCTTVNTDRAKEYFKVNHYGVYVNEVVNENGKKAGLQAGDLIVSIKDKVITSYEDIQNVLNNSTVGEEVVIAIERGGVISEIKMILPEKSNN